MNDAMDEGMYPRVAVPLPWREEGWNSIQPRERWRCVTRSLTRRDSSSREGAEAGSLAAARRRERLPARREEGSPARQEEGSLARRREGAGTSSSGGGLRDVVRVARCAFSLRRFSQTSLAAFRLAAAE